MTFRGADTDQLREVADRLDRAASELDANRARLVSDAQALAWSGADADRFRSDVDGGVRASAQALVDRITTMAGELRRQAADQDHTSASLDATVGAPRTFDGVDVRAGFGHFPPRYGEHSFGYQLFASIKEGMTAGGVHHGGPAPDEIEIRRLDNGSYIVVLPGVTDLTKGLEKGGGAAKWGLLGGLGPAAASGFSAMKGEWDATNPSDSPRDMYYAQMSEESSQNGSVTGANAYAVMVKQAMQAAGVPEGAPVMLVGHSFGAYTALELASDPTFNAAMHGDGAYRVNVTHVLAAGANAGFRLDDLPSGTRALLMNNDLDPAVAMERAVPANNDVHADAVHQYVTFRDLRTDGESGYGHGELVYAQRIMTGGDPKVDDFVGDAFSQYGGGGDLVRVAVKDPYR